MSSEGIDRRTLLSTAAVAASLFPYDVSAAEPPPVVRSPRMTAYEVKQTIPFEMQPLTPKGERRVIQGLAASSAAVLIGSHGTAEDAAYAVRLVRQLAESAASGKGRGMILALASLPATPETQRALDAYLREREGDAAAAAAAEAALLGAVEWTGDAAVDVDAELVVLRQARALGVGVVAAGVPRGLVEAVAAKGLEALDPKASSELVRDPKRFVEAVAAPGFKRYSDLVVGDLHERLGGGSGGAAAAATSTPTLANFFASRILVDEAVVSAAAAALATRAGSAMGTPAAPLLVLLAPVDRVKFGFGCQARLERALAPPVEEQSAPAPAPMVRSIILNPTVDESLSPSSGLRLSLSAGDDKDARPLANFLLFSASPPTKILTRMLNPIS